MTGTNMLNDMISDEKMMMRAIDNATKARPACLPNPWVGAVLVSSDDEVFDGYTQKFGQSHAEVICIDKAGGRAQGATLYTTLEPCSHKGKTGPCILKIIESGINRVVIGTKDPDEHVNGAGVSALEDAGIEVATGLLENLVVNQLEPYLHHRKTGRPYVIAKIAATMDGKVAAPDGSSQWITGAEARSEGHRLRAFSDAICVGRGTVLADNPQLTVRDWTPEGGSTESLDPKRIVLGTIPEEAAIRPCYEHQGSLEELLEKLGHEGALQLLVEGGATTLKAFHEERLIDRYEIFLAPAFMEGDNGMSIFSGNGISTISELWRGQILEVNQLGNDLKITIIPEHD